MLSDFEKAQIWEGKWHGDCTLSSYMEESKQIIYAKKMGLTALSELGQYPVYDLQNKNICDIGSGPYSLLIKSKNLGQCYAVDPCPSYPEWVSARYACKGINFLRIKGEDINPEDFKDTEEVFIYNCLQHTDNPKQIIDNAKKIGKIIRLFEWLETGVNEGHLHNLHENEMNEWLGGIGKTEQLNESGCHGLSYYGIFKGNHYDK